MTLSINSQSALTAQRSMSASQSALQTSMQRLSSGLRINSAKDDAAGLAISDRMTAQVRGLNQAVRNANDGISLSQTAEGGLQESTNVLQRMRELAVQSANDTNSTSDRTALQKEVTALKAEMDRISNTTSFGGKKLLDGSFTSQQFQVGSDANQTVGVSIANAGSSFVGSNTLASDGSISAATTAAANVAGGNNVTAQTLNVSGYLGTASIGVGLAASAKTIAANVNLNTASTGVEATARTDATLSAVTAGTVDFDLFGSNATAAHVTANVVSTSDLGALTDAINSKASSTGITATLSATKDSITLSSATGDDIKLQDFTDSTAAGTATLKGGSGGGVLLTTGTAGDSSVVGGTVSFDSSNNFTVTPTTANVTVVSTHNSTLSQVSSINIGTQGGATSALSVIDGALTQIDSMRADLGAVQNRFSSTISNLQNISQSVDTARSRVQDADFAQETANLSKNQVLQQAGMAMLAQANQSGQQILSLLR